MIPRPGSNPTAPNEGVMQVKVSLSESEDECAPPKKRGKRSKGPVEVIDLEGNSSDNNQEPEIEVMVS